MSSIQNNTNNSPPIAHSHTTRQEGSANLTKIAFIATQLIAAILITIVAVLIGCNLIGLGVGLTLVGMGVATLAAGAIAIAVKKVKTAIAHKKELAQEQMVQTANKQLDETIKIVEEKLATTTLFKEKYITINSLYTNQHEKLQQQQQQLSDLKNTFETSIKKLTRAKETLSIEIEEEQSTIEKNRKLLQPQFIESESLQLPFEKNLQILKGDLQQAKLQRLQLTDQLNAIKYNLAQRSTANQLKQKIKEFDEKITFLNEQIKITQDKLIQLSNNNLKLGKDSLNLNRAESFLDTKKNALSKILDALKADSEILKQILTAENSLNASVQDLERFAPLIQEFNPFTFLTTIEKDLYEKLESLNNNLSSIILTENDALILLKKEPLSTNLDQLSLDIHYQIK
ncbi:hypothetical protein CLAVI_000921 [Candidatus Clavichlamydia salmonicola]|uniref:hypothetical protein n=1 Tax=Candidatus Clavichlamydia salmonicola TaxID=469812 RepID=UPI0018913DF4|nr:hypothetical protein [Candidatus Clavichlamydia salmonicola]MBF5051280.1 hypothetical protein [Candidatus Clavichlamydia salmonicola]